MTETKHYRVAIIGAGASGLTCAQTLITKYKIDPSNIVILEANDYVGGRVRTSIHSVPTLTRKEKSHHVVQVDGTESETFVEKVEQVYVDEGAAWVHGTGTAEEPNPIFPLIRLAGGDITPISPFNQGTEPRKMLYQKINFKSEQQKIVGSYNMGSGLDEERHYDEPSSLLALFLDGKELSNTPSAQADDLKIKASIAEKEILDKSLELYEKRMSQIIKIGNLAYEAGEGMLLSRVTLKQALEIMKEEEKINKSSKKEKSSKNIKKSMNENEFVFRNLFRTLLLPSGEQRKPCKNDESKLIELVAGFHMHLFETWHGAGLHQLPLDAFMENEEDEDDVNSCNHYNCQDGDTLGERDPGDGSYPGPHAIVKSEGGMSLVIKSLLKHGVESCVYTEEEVVAVECDIPNYDQNDKQSLVHLKCKSGLKVDADVCICTISLGCLKSSLRRNDDNIVKSWNRISFSPKLSKDKIDAIQTLQMGMYKKVFLIFDKIFWPVNKLFLGLVRQSRECASPKIEEDDNFNEEEIIDIGNYLMIDNLWVHRGLPCMEVTLVGESAENAVHKPDGQIKKAVLNFVFDSFIPNREDFVKFPKCIDCHITRWEEDTYFRGAYSYYSYNATERHFEALRATEWDGRLIFAGEALDSVHQGSLHSAILSGKEAADKAVKIERIKDS